MIFIFSLLLTSLLSSLLPLILGMFIAILLKSKASLIKYLLYISAGTILALVCYDLFPELLETANATFKNFGILLIFVVIILTILLMFLLHILISKMQNLNHNHNNEPSHIEAFLNNKNNSFFKAGILLFISLLLHNFPEGISLGFILKNNFSEGVSLAIFLAIHNLTMGTSLTIPLLLANTKKKNIILFILLTYLPSLLGSILGYSCYEINKVLMFFVFAIVSGILIYVVLEELTSLIHVKKTKHRIISIFCFLISFLAFALLNLFI